MGKAYLRVGMWEKWKKEYWGEKPILTLLS
jgi:hypothetical protein